jgi:hypothetical protein
MILHLNNTLKSIKDILIFLFSFLEARKNAFVFLI